MNTPHALIRHPASPPSPVTSVSATLQIEPHDLVIHYLLRGHLDAVRWPPRSDGGPADALWQHTCLEAFIAPETGSAYREFNFSPSGHWAHYAFASERQRHAAGTPVRAPLLDMRRTSAGYELVAVLDRASLPAARVLQIGLSAVIESIDGHTSHWALHHPKDKPDFHDRSGWTLQLPND